MAWYETLRRLLGLEDKRSHQAGGAAPPRVNGGTDAEREAETLKACLTRVETCWQRLGETEPHWSVLTSSRFKSDRIAETGDEFYASGEGDVGRLMEAANRCGLVLPFRGTCFELGCGVGRLTPWLAKSFDRVIAADISPSHLALAEQAIRNAGCQNVELRHVNRLETFERLPTFDCFLSLIVLQHNPPPVIRWLLIVILSKLSVGGVGFFQVPTALPAYSFDADAYLANPPSDGLMEMHALPLEVVLSTIGDARCELLEASKHDVADTENAMFMEFFVRRFPGSPSVPSLVQR